MKKNILIALLVFISGLCYSQKIKDNSNVDFINSIMNLSRSTDWKLVKKIQLQFPVYHVQGMLKIGNYFYISSAKIIKKTERINDSKEGYDRTPGKGIGYLFKVDLKGNLVSKTEFGIGDIYHPGGIDFDGEYIWVPVSEYRPNSRAIIYRVNPDTMKSELVFRFGDHIGTIACSKSGNTLYGSSWGSRRWYVWNLNPKDYLNQSKLGYNIPPYKMQLNSDQFIDYQDTHNISNKYILCSGLASFKIKSIEIEKLKSGVKHDIGKVAFGGFDLIDAETLKPVFQLPVNLRIASGLCMNNNPFYAEYKDNKLIFYFIPQSDGTTSDNGGVNIFEYNVK